VPLPSRPEGHDTQGHKLRKQLGSGVARCVGAYATCFPVLTGDTALALHRNQLADQASVRVGGVKVISGGLLRSPPNYFVAPPQIGTDRKRWTKTWLRLVQQMRPVERESQGSSRLPGSTGLDRRPLTFVSYGRIQPVAKPRTARRSRAQQKQE
jgi:hypothetical protein